MANSLVKLFGYVASNTYSATNKSKPKSLKDCGCSKKSKKTKTY